MSFFSRFRRSQILHPSKTPVGWKDLTAALSSAQVPPANDPTLKVFGPSGVRREFAFSIGHYLVVGSFHVNHDVMPGGKAFLHVHWSCGGTNTQPVHWRLAVMRAKGHGQEAFYDAGTFDLIQAPTGVPWQHMIVECSEEQALILTEPDELIMVTITRVTNGGTNNPNDIFGLTVDFHYQSDRDVTPRKSPNFFERDYSE